MFNFKTLSALISITTLSMFMFACAEDIGDSSSESFDEYSQEAFALRSRGNKSVQQGEFAYLDSYLNESGETYGAVAGRGQLVRQNTRTLTASVSVAGLSPNTFFGGHLHRSTCADGGGAHMQDPASCPLNRDGTNSCTATFPGNELWVGGTTDASGRLAVQSTADWWIPLRTRGQKAKNLSFIIHDTPNNGGSGAGPKMLCVDLNFERVTRGHLSYVTEGLTDDDRSDTVRVRRAQIIRKNNGTTIAKLSWSGLRPKFKYPSHIHAARCTEVSNGGPHYVQDIACVGNEGNTDEGCEATAETEFWVGGTTNKRGKMNVTTRIPQTARAGALSLILHECLNESGKPADNGVCAQKPRFACIDFY
jgi:hypothetical protein